MAVSFIGGGNHRPAKLTMLVVIGTDCIVSCKSNYHMITTTTAPTFGISYLYSDHMICAHLYKYLEISVSLWC